MDYREDEVLTEYVWSYGSNYMTRLEKLGLKAVSARFKAKYATPALDSKIIDKWGEENNSEVVDALSKGVDEFKMAVRDRVLQDNPEFVKRCPKCNKVIRTPRAKQCRWYLHDWH